MDQEILEMLENKKWKMNKDREELGRDSDYYEYLLIKQQTYQEIIDMIHKEILEETKCKNCQEWVKELGSSELAQQDSICQNCMEEGYGR